MARTSAFTFLKNQSTRHLVQRLIQDFARPHRRPLVGGVICMLLVALTSVSTAKLIEPIINDIFISKQAEMLLPITFMIIGVFLIKGLASYGESVLMAYAGQHIVADIQKTMFRHIITGDLTFFHQTSTGELVSRFTNDINKLNSAVTGTLTNIGRDGLMLIAFVLFMFGQDWVLAAIAFLVLPLAIIPVLRIGKRLRKASTNIQENTGVLTALLTQAFQGIRLVKSYGLESKETSLVHQTIDIIFNRTLRASRAKSAAHPLMEFLGGIAIAVVVIYGGSQVIKGEQNPGAFFSFITALLMTYEPLKRLANLNANLQDQLAAVSRVFSFLDLKPSIVSAPQASSLKVNQGEIKLDHVSFNYGEGPILQDVHLTIQAGQTVAFVGTSGAGKSTLLNLIMRFYDVSQGLITIDDQDIRKITLESLRRNIALVSQEVVLFNASIRDNILYGHQEATEAQMIVAAKGAAAHDFICEFPKGYDTRVGEQGVRLSGGQRQRIAIARALLKNAPILLLDEPTSALDGASEGKVQQALNTLMKDRTTLIVAHRLTTVMDAHRIFVLDQGRLIASGTHKDLLRNNPHYAQLYQAQRQSGLNLLQESPE